MQPLEASTCSTPACIGTKYCFKTVDISEGLCDAELYHHYLQHTSHTLTYYQNDQSALQIGMPTLALQNKAVFHSLLAVSATCLACDMIKDATADASEVNRVLMTGYRHYNLASERMRALISQPNGFEPQHILASAILLTPFAAASQQVNHWISSRTKPQMSCRLLSSTPKDVIVIMRGIRTTLENLDCTSLRSNLETAGESKSENVNSVVSPETNIPLAALPPSRTHMMTSMIASTSQLAFRKLESRLESAFIHCGESSKDSLSACSAAFEILKSIRNKAFFTPNSFKNSSFLTQIEKIAGPGPFSLTQMNSWLHDYLSRSTIPLPTGPLTRFFLTFLVQIPQAYLDLLLPLLDQRLEVPACAMLDNLPAEMSREQALALDIYAHWSVLMFLVEEESWWIGKLPVVTLAGMVNRYGGEFVTKLLPTNDTGQEKWWPSSMLDILQEVKQHR